MPAQAHHQRPPLWRNTDVLKWGLQVVVLALVVASLWFVVAQATSNLDEKGIPVDYDWLDDPAGIQLSEGIDTRPNSLARALWAGMVNTLRLAVTGIVFSTVLGVIVGVARLSHNWMARKIAAVYVESLRNVPILVQILLWFAILSTVAPELTAESGYLGDLVYVSKKGISVPRVALADGFYQWLALMVVFGAGIWAVRRRLRRTAELSGGTVPVARVTLGLTAAAASVAWFANPIMAWVGEVFAAIAEVWGSIPEALMQVLLSLAAVAAAVAWIRRFLNSRRTPAGLAKLTDDDWFRIAFAAVAAGAAVAVLGWLWPGLSSWVVNSGHDFWDLAASKFGGGRDARPFDALRPQLAEGNFVNYGPQGLTLTVFFAALLLGLVFYTSSFIAEIVRGGILAVPPGQSEAAAALGLSRAQALRKVILPQAFRVIMPPLGNQYLNITKNTSLAIAVGLSDVVQVSQTVYNKNNQTLAVFGIVMTFFLACSLLISAVVNYLNRRLALVER